MSFSKNKNQTLSSLAREVGLLLSSNNLTCAVAESCTGGMIGAAITSIAGSSTWFRGGVIVYTNELKQQFLGVPEETLSSHGAVSSETVTAMVSGAVDICNADCAVAVSGIAGPGGGTPEKPVGLVFIGCSFNGTISVFKHHFKGNRNIVRHSAAAAALRHLIDRIKMEKSV